MKNLIYKDVANVPQNVAFSPFEEEHSQLIQAW